MEDGTLNNIISKIVRRRTQVHCIAWAYRLHHYSAFDNEGLEICEQWSNQLLANNHDIMERIRWQYGVNPEPLLHSKGPL